MHKLAASIRNIPDFPKPGIVFRDITTLLKDPAAVKQATDIFFDRYKNSRIERVACIESRGFILGSLLAMQLGVGIIPIRKRNKLPAAKVQEEYDLEYGTDSIEMHVDAVTPGERILIHDDLLATGGTAAAACRMVKKLGGDIVGLPFLIELSFLKGREKIKEYDVFSIIQYDAE